MPFNRATLTMPKASIPAILSYLVLILLASWGLTELLTPLWQTKMAIFHTGIELICVFTALAIFFAVWYTYEHNSPVDNLVGFGFLAVAVFDLFHTFYSQSLNLYPAGHYDISVKYWLLGRFSGALILLLTTVSSLRVAPNKWLGLFSAVTIPTTICYSVLFFPDFYPILLIKGQGLTPIKIASEYVIIGLYLLALLRMKNKNRINHRLLITYHYIFMATLIAIPGEICFTLYTDIPSFYQLLGHTLRIVFYGLLFKGIIASAVTYPYQKLHETNQTVHAILNALPTGVITSSQEGDLLFANRRARVILGRHIDRVLPQFRSFEIKKRHIDKVITINLLGSTPVKLRLDARFLADGTSLYLFNEAKSEQTLEYIKLQTLTILDAITNPVFIVNNHDIILMANKAFSAIAGIDIKAVAGTKLRSITDLLQVHSEQMFGTESTAITGYKTILTTVQGNPKEFITYIAPITNVENEIIGHIFVSTDITGLAEQQIQLQQREKLAALGQMAAGIVHEIKNPLTTLKGFSQLINVKASDPVIRKYAQIMETEANDVNKVVSDFLMFAKPQPVLTELALNELIQSIQVVLESNAFIHGVCTEFSLAPRELPVLADPSQIKQVILNIVDNAISAMEQTIEPCLHISTELTAKAMIIAISDNGIGIPEANIDKVGTPFFTTKDNGTGLGLSICYQIVKEHNGCITIDSEPGRGTTFRISLPCLPNRALDATMY